MTLVHRPAFILHRSALPAPAADEEADDEAGGGRHQERLPRVLPRVVLRLVGILGVVHVAQPLNLFADHSGLVGDVVLGLRGRVRHGLAVLLRAFADARGGRGRPRRRAAAAARRAEAGAAARRAGAAAGAAGRAGAAHPAAEFVLVTRSV